MQRISQANQGTYMSALYVCFICMPYMCALRETSVIAKRIRVRDKRVRDKRVRDKTRSHFRLIHNVLSCTPHTECVLMHTSYRMCFHVHRIQNVFSCTPLAECVFMYTAYRMRSHVHLIQNVWSVVRQISYRMCSQTRRKPS
jgi:hypothetical protein